MFVARAHRTQARALLIGTRPQPPAHERVPSQPQPCHFQAPAMEGTALLNPDLGRHPAPALTRPPLAPGWRLAGWCRFKPPMHRHTHTGVLPRGRADPGSATPLVAPGWGMYPWHRHHTGVPGVGHGPCLAPAAIFCFEFGKPNKNRAKAKNKKIRCFATCLQL